MANPTDDAATDALINTYIKNNGGGGGGPAKTPAYHVDYIGGLGYVLDEYDNIVRPYLDPATGQQASQGKPASTAFNPLTQNAANFTNWISDGPSGGIYTDPSGAAWYGGNFYPSAAAAISVANGQQNLAPPAPKASGLSNLHQDASGQWWGFNGQDWTQIPGGPPVDSPASSGSRGGTIVTGGGPNTFGGGGSGSASASTQIALANARAASDAQNQGAQNAQAIQLEQMREASSAQQNADSLKLGYAQLDATKARDAQSAAAQQRQDQLNAASALSKDIGSYDVNALPAFLMGGGGNIMNALQAHPYGALTQAANTPAALDLQTAALAGATIDPNNPYAGLISGASGGSVGSGPSAAVGGGSTSNAGGGTPAAPGAASGLQPWQMYAQALGVGQGGNIGGGHTESPADPVYSPLAHPTNDAMGSSWLDTSGGLHTYGPNGEIITYEGGGISSNDTANLYTPTGNGQWGDAAARYGPNSSGTGNVNWWADNGHGTTAVPDNPYMGGVPSSPDASWRYQHTIGSMATDARGNLLLGPAGPNGTGGNPIGTNLGFSGKDLNGNPSFTGLGTASFTQMMPKSYYTSPPGTPSYNQYGAVTGYASPNKAIPATGPGSSLAAATASNTNNPQGLVWNPKTGQYEYPNGPKPAVGANGTFGTIPGLTTPGNINLNTRPVAINPGGDISTVRSMSFGDDGGEHLVPTVSPAGTILSNNDAIQQFYNTGQQLGTFNSPTAADSYAERLHNQQAAMYSNPQTATETSRAVQGYAAGGAFSGAGVVGERGKELVLTSGPAMVVNQQQAKQNPYLDMLLNRAGHHDGGGTIDPYSAMVGSSGIQMKQPTTEGQAAPLAPYTSYSAPKTTMPVTAQPAPPMTTQPITAQPATGGMVTQPIAAQPSTGVSTPAPYTPPMTYNPSTGTASHQPGAETPAAQPASGFGPYPVGNIAAQPIPATTTPTAPPASGNYLDIIDQFRRNATTPGYNPYDVEFWGKTPFEQQMQANSFQTQTGVPADLYLQQADALRLKGVNRHPVYGSTLDYGY